MSTFLKDMTDAMDVVGASYMQLHFRERTQGPPVYVLIVQGAEEIDGVMRAVRAVLAGIDNAAEQAADGIE